MDDTARHNKELLGTFLKADLVKTSGVGQYTDAELAHVRAVLAALDYQYKPEGLDPDNKDFAGVLHDYVKTDSKGIVLGSVTLHLDKGNTSGKVQNGMVNVRGDEFLCGMVGKNTTISRFVENLSPDVLQDILAESPVDHVRQPFKTRQLPVSDEHSLYVAQYGNPKGLPVLFLHGGPGAGFSPEWQDYFNQDFFHLVFFDQRGCGKSQPLNSVQNNSIQKTNDDINTICTKLDLERPILCGGSYGSLQALDYASKYPENVRHLLVRGIFLGTKKNADHIAEENGTRPYDSAHFEAYRDYIPAEIRARDGLIKAYDHIMKNGTHEQQCEAAKRFMMWDNSISRYNPEDAHAAIEDAHDNPADSIAITKLFMHYAVHEFSDDYDERLLNVPALHHIPMDIIHGADDRICDPKNAFRLHAAYPHSRLHLCEQTGHSGMEPKTIEAHRKVSDLIRLANP